MRAPNQRQRNAEAAQKESVDINAFYLLGSAVIVAGTTVPLAHYLIGGHDVGHLAVLSLYWLLGVVLLVVGRLSKNGKESSD